MLQKKNGTFEVVVGLIGCGLVIVVLAVKLAVIGGLGYVAYHFLMKVW